MQSLHATRKPHGGVRNQRVGAQRNASEHANLTNNDMPPPQRVGAQYPAPLHVIGRTLADTRTPLRAEGVFMVTIRLANECGDSDPYR